MNSEKDIYFNKLGESGTKDYWHKWAKQFYADLKMAVPDDWWERTQKRLYLERYEDKYGNPIYDLK